MAVYYFIWNPSAGNGRVKQALPIIEDVMKDRGIAYTMLQTVCAGHAEKLAKEAAQDPEAEAVTAIGGDGTLQEIASGLAGTGVPMAVMPLGNGNDFAHNIIDMRGCRTIADKTNHCLDVLLGGECLGADLLRANGRYALNEVNMGLDADVAELAGRIKSRVGSLSYLFSLVKNIFTYRPFQAKLTADGHTLGDKGGYTLAALCNGDTYGGGFQIAPPALIDDGRISACIVQKMPRLKILVMFPLVLMGGRHTGLKQVQMLECQRLLIEFQGEMKLTLDGNMFSWASPIEISIEPGAIKLIAQKGVAGSRERQQTRLTQAATV